MLALQAYDSVVQSYNKAAGQSRAPPVLCLSDKQITALFTPYQVETILHVTRLTPTIEALPD